MDCDCGWSRTKWIQRSPSSWRGLTRAHSFGPAGIRLHRIPFAASQSAQVSPGEKENHSPASANTCGCTGPEILEQSDARQWLSPLLGERVRVRAVVTHFSGAQGKQQTVGKIECGNSSNGAPRTPAKDGCRAPAFRSRNWFQIRPYPDSSRASGCHVFTRRLAATNACMDFCDLFAVIGVTEFAVYC